MKAAWVLGVIGGSGLYDLGDGTAGAWETIRSPWGEPSDQVFRAKLAGVDVVFLPRHGRAHRLGPSRLNYRANIDILKRAGCTDLLSVSACGSLREDFAPGDFVVVDQFIDRTFLRESSFFGDGVVAHVSMAHPVCPRLGGLAGDAAEAAGARVHRGGVYLAMEGPQFSTLAELRLYRAWGCDVIGMTNMPEAKLAREAELPYATLAMVTDYDCWREETAPVRVADIQRVLGENAELARQTVQRLATALGGAPRTPDPLGVDTCLDTAVITPPSQWAPAVAEKLAAVAARRLQRRADG